MTERANPSAPRDCDLLAAYELGLLQDEERIRFETHLTRCPDCLEELYAFAPVAAAVTAEPGRYALAASGPGLLDRLSRALNGIFRPRVLAPVTIAAVLALLVLLPTGSRWRDLAVVEPLAWSHVPVRAADDPAGKLFSDGMLMYEAGNYDQAAPILLQAARVMENSDHSALPLGAGSPGQARLYAGVSLLLANRPQAAKRPLTVAAANPLPPVAQGAQWYLVQDYLLCDQPDSARIYLESLQDSPVYGSRARSLLETMQEQ